MQRTWKTLTVGVALATALSASSAFAAQNVANTSQKGSLLIFPTIDVRPGRNTIIRIANDNGARNITVKCYYMNEAKGRSDFMFHLTSKDAQAWEVLLGGGEQYNFSPFPTHAEIAFGNPLLGELVCFAVNRQGSAQVKFNHLSGTATVHDHIYGTSYEYNSWNFIARGGTELSPHGRPGTLELTGANDGESYDACPTYNIVHFSPFQNVAAYPVYTLAPPVTAPANAFNVVTEIGVSLCNQDLRQDFTPHWTKYVLNVWNDDEVKFTGAYECADSTHHFALAPTGLIIPIVPPLQIFQGVDNLPNHFSAAVIRSNAAWLEMRGKFSPQCAPFLPAGAVTENGGAVAVSVTLSALSVAGGLDLTAHGTTTNTAGFYPTGQVLWDPQDDITPEMR